MGFTPPPEKLGRARSSAVLTPAFLAALRGATFDTGAVRLASGEQRWPLIDAEGHWTLTTRPDASFTPSTLRLLTAGVLQADGTILVGAARWWLVDVDLCDGTRLALCVAA
jgi:hypothetical protein